MVDNLDSQTRLEPVKEEAAIRSVGWGSVSDSLGPEDKKETEAAEKSTTSAIAVSKMRTQLCYLMVDEFRW